MTLNGTSTFSLDQSIASLPANTRLPADRPNLATAPDYDHVLLSRSAALNPGNITRIIGRHSSDVEWREKLSATVIQDRSELALGSHSHFSGYLM